MAFAPATAEQLAALPKRPRRHHAWLVALGVLGLGIAALVAAAAALQPPAPCMHSCGVASPPSSSPPPSSPPLSFSKIFRSSTLAFEVAYDPSYAGSPTSSSSSSVGWEYQLQHGGYLDATVSGVRSNGQATSQVVDAMKAAHFSQFSPVYSLPSPGVGYVVGSGEVYEGQWTPLSGQSQTERMAIVAATKGGLTIRVVCEAPKAHDTGEHPNPAQIGDGADQFCDDLLNSISWPGSTS